jgi:integration host factor subunit beta
LSVVKSDLIKELAENYPNFLKKDLIKLFDISIYEMLEAIKRGERVELRENFSIEPRIQKARVSTNPKTKQKLNTPEKKSILFKISQEWKKRINEKE